jgi:methionine transaminase
MQKIKSRLPDVGTSIFTIMSKMAHDCGAINLSQGFPDFPIDPLLIDLVHKYMLAGHNQYAPMPGVPALRQAISEVIQRTYNRNVDPDQSITVTSGATEGIYSAITAFISPGDEVIVFDPSYDSYDPAIRLNGGIPVHINMTFPDFSIDWEHVEKRIGPRTRMVIINTPHNPSGTVLAREDLLYLNKLAQKHNLLVISDEVYERLVFDNHVHYSVLSFPELASRSVAVFSFGKTFHATGWKCGYTVAPPELNAEIRRAHQFTVFSVNTPLQLALAEYMKNPETYSALGAFYQRKRDLFLREIAGSSFEPLPSRGSYFQNLSYKNISTMGDVAMAEDLTRKLKVASIPVSVFYKDNSDHHILRFCFAKKDETLAEAGAILKKL